MPASTGIQEESLQHEHEAKSAFDKVPSRTDAIQSACCARVERRLRACTSYKLLLCLLCTSQLASTADQTAPRDAAYKSSLLFIVYIITDQQ